MTSNFKWRSKVCYIFDTISIYAARESMLHLLYPNLAIFISAALESMQ